MRQSFQPKLRINLLVLVGYTHAYWKQSSAVIFFFDVLNASKGGTTQIKEYNRSKQNEKVYPASSRRIYVFLFVNWKPIRNSSRIYGRTRRQVS